METGFDEFVLYALTPYYSWKNRLSRPCGENWSPSSSTEIELNNLDEGALRRVWAFLRSLGAFPDEATLAMLPEGNEVPLREVSDPVRLIAADEAAPVNVPFTGIRLSGSTIPWLGCFVYPDSILFYYDPGDGWGPAEVRALCELLRQIQRLASGVEIAADRNFAPSARDQFRRGLELYFNSKGV